MRTVPPPVEFPGPTPSVIVAGANVKFQAAGSPKKRMVTGTLPVFVTENEKVTLPPSGIVVAPGGVSRGRRKEWYWGMRTRLVA